MKNIYIDQKTIKTSPEIVNERMKKVRAIRILLRNLQIYFLIKEDRELTQDQTEKPVEEQIYNGFPSSKTII